MTRCGCCNSRLTSTTFVNKYKNASGEVVKYSHNKSYRCTGKLQGKTICDGQGTFSANKVEGFVLEQMKNYLRDLRMIDFTKEINEIKNANTDEKKLKVLQDTI